MKTKVARWGNSLAVRLPAEVVREFGLTEGQVLDLTARRPVIEITAPSGGRRYVNGIPVYSREEMIADMDRLGASAVPGSLDWGPARGSEIIDDEYTHGDIIAEDLPRGRDDQSR